MSPQATFDAFEREAELRDEHPDRWGPTMDRPLPREEQEQTMYESGGEMVDRREIPDSGLSLSDITDWTYINDERRPTWADEEEENLAELVGKTTRPDAGGEKPAVADGGQQLEKPQETLTVYEEAEAVGDEWEGEYLYTSWGYGQTNVEMAKIVDVSGSGKTVLARMVRPEQVGSAKASESLAPTNNEYGEEFRLHVRVHDSGVSFRGSYPFIDGDPDEGERMGSFGHWGDKETVHQTPSQYGH